MVPIAKRIVASSTDLIYDVAERSLRAHLQVVQHYLPLAVQNWEEDVEYVHQLRVSSRRATASLRLYRDLLPWGKAARVKKQLSKIRRAANDARDDDVLIRRLEQDTDDPGAADLLKRVRKHREDSQEPLRRLFARLGDGEKLDRRIAQLLKATRQRAKADKHATMKFRKWARKNMRPYVEDFFHRANADVADHDAVHQLRISGKKLRYTMELLAGAFPPRFSKKLFPRVKSIQDRLGEINDLVTTKSRYERWIEDSKQARESDYLQRLVDEQEALLAERCANFAAWFTAERADRFFKAFDEVISGRRAKQQRDAIRALDTNG